MQPTLIAASAVPGLIYVNGRLTGEVEEGRPLALPVSPVGAVYLEHRPLGRTHLPMAQRITFSDGEPLAESLENAEGVEAVLWPGNRLEVELSPQAACCGLPEPARREGLCCTRWGNRLLIEQGAIGASCVLPEGALMPDVLPLGALRCLKGGLEGGGEYAQVYAPDFSALLLSLTGERIRADAEGALEVLVDPQDLVGHARLEVWQAGEGGCFLARSEPVWSRGAPAWPQTPQDTALAALQAAQQGLTDEARGYLAPQAACEEALVRARESRGCVPLPWPIPSGEPCVGLLQLVNEHLLRVEPVSFSATPLPGLQGPWRLTRLACAAATPSGFA